MKKTTYIALLACILASSCIPNKSLVYLQSEGDVKEREFESPINNYLLRAEDVVVVDVVSADPKVSELFNGVGKAENNVPRGSSVAGLYLEGLTIDSKGNILLPSIGNINIAGMSLEAAKETIQRAVDSLFNNTVVRLKLVSFRVTVLGEVNNPGLIYFYNDRLSLLEALGLAGDLTEFGNRQNIQLIRQKGDKRVIKTVDISKVEMLGSPDYFLLPGDIIYVEPMKAGTQRFNLPVVSIVLSSITTVFVVLTLFRN